MKTETGLWIDHRRAVILTITPLGQQTAEIHSNSPTFRGHEAGEASASSHEDRKVKATDSQQREFTAHLDRYYDEVVQAVGDADSIFVFGPGEAKGEFKKRLEHASLGDRLSALETADKMTDHQIAAKIREHFHHKHLDSDV